MVHLGNTDMQLLKDTVTDVSAMRDKDKKCTMEVSLSVGKAKVYHMGLNNPVIRIDIRLEGQNG